MFWLTVILALAINVFAETPQQLWHDVLEMQDKPVYYDEIVVLSGVNGFSVRYFKVYRLDAENERREEVGSYHNQILQVELVKNQNKYVWLEGFPYVLEKEKPKTDHWFPTLIEQGFVDEKEISILYLESEQTPLTVRKFITRGDNLVIKEEVYYKDNLIQVIERKNIQTNPLIDSTLFNIPETYTTYSDRRKWEQKLVIQFIGHKTPFSVLYPSYLPKTWELTDVSINNVASSEILVYRFCDGEEVYSLFLKPVRLVIDKNGISIRPKTNKSFTVLYKDNMGVFQMERDDYVITLVGRLKEKDALKIIESLTALY